MTTRAYWSATGCCASTPSSSRPERRHDARLRWLLCAVAIAAIAALLWAATAWLVQGKRPDSNPDDRLHDIVRVLVRFFLCEMLLGYGFAKSEMLLGYGFAKVFPLQFAQPSAFRLGQQLGDMSPMGLLWTFMGFSPIQHRRMLRLAGPKPPAAVYLISWDTESKKLILTTGSKGCLTTDRLAHG
jgi:4-amino-4-deoxy-L-arabinose transferase-like glycosyltransferase